MLINTEPCIADNLSMIFYQSTEASVDNLQQICAPCEQVMSSGIRMLLQDFFEFFTALPTEIVTQDQVFAFFLENDLVSCENRPFGTHSLVIPCLGVPLYNHILVILCYLFLTYSLSLPAKTDHQFWLPMSRQTCILVCANTHLPHG